MIDVPQGVKVISFDIFDTLIIRPFVRPTDLFRLIESNLGIDGFAKERIEAEKRAKQGKMREITLDEIYSEMIRHKDLKDTEIDYELSLCMRNESVCNELASLSKTFRIILSSDMYLPESVIRSILEKNEIEFDELYLSSEKGFTKYRGTIFKHILENEKI